MLKPHKRDARWLASLLAAILLLPGPAAFAQSGVDVPAEEASEEEKFAERVEALEASVARHRAQIETLVDRVGSAEGLSQAVFERRLDEAQLELFEVMLDLAREVSDARDSEIDVSTYGDEVRAILETLPATAIESAKEIQERVSLQSQPDSPSDAILADQQLAVEVEEIDEIFASLIDYLEVAGEFNVDVAATRAQVSTMLSESAANRSVYLELANTETAKLRKAAAALTNDQELSGWLSAMEARALVASDALESSIELMNRLELDTDHYRQQLLASTGQISTDVLDVGFLANLVSEWTTRATEITVTRGPTFVFSIILALILLLLFVQFGKLAQSLVARGLNSQRVHVSNLLQRMILSTVRNLIIIVGALVALSQLGISLGPLLAGLGIAGFIIGFALQDTLSNFASGLMILFYRPFDVGDFVEVAGVKGKVDKMSMVNTTFLTIDNQKLVVPNNMIWQSVIANYTDQTTRRVDLVFGISYDDDIDKAEAVVHEVLSNYDAVLQDPAPVVKVGELADSSVNLIVRPWVATEAYWDTYWDLTKLIKQAFDREGITIPFPQRDVHVQQQSA